MRRNSTSNNCLTKEEIRGFSSEKLNPSDKENIQKHLKDCNLCASVTRNYQYIDEKELQEDLEAIRKAVYHRVAQRRRQKTFSPVLKMAASFLLLIAMVGTYFYWNTTKNNRLFSQYYTAFDVKELNLREVVTTYDEAGSTTDKTLSLGLKAYESGDYKESATLFDSFLEKSPSNTDAIFMSALAHLGENQLVLAIDKLEKIQSNEKYKADALWYLSLAHLKKGDKKIATKNLQNLLTFKNFYQEKAQDLLEHL